MALFELTGTTRDYPWGSLDGISQILGRPPAGHPEAELWMGAHPSAPALTRSKEGTTQDLLTLLSTQPEHLGSFATLPFLFKILSAAQPLSLQAHPSPAQAAQGFADENARGIPLAAPHRNYKDASHKPELILALTDFAALCGFLPAAAIKERFARYGLFHHPLAPLVDDLKPQGAPPSVKALFRGIFGLSAAVLRSSVDAIRERALLREDGFSGHLVALTDRYGADPGVVASLMLDYKELKPGEVLFMPAQVLHSYLAGTGLEIMASSDNVLRGGLTPKHVDLDELSRTLRFEPYEASPVTTHRQDDAYGSSVVTFAPPVDEFQLSIVALSPGATLTSRGPHILLTLTGSGQLRSGDQELLCSQGSQSFCSADGEYSLAGDLKVAIAAPAASAPLLLAPSTPSLPRKSA